MLTNLKKDFPVIREILKFTKPYKYLLWISLFLVIVNVFIQFAYVWVQQVFINVVGSGDAYNFKNIIFLTFIFIFCTTFLVFTGNVLKDYFNEIISKDMILHTFQHFNKIPYFQIRKFHSGDLVSRLTDDIQSLSRIITLVIYQFASNTLLCILSFVYLSSLHFYLSIIILASGMLTFLLGRLFDRHIRATSMKINEENASIRGNLQEIFQGYELIRAYSLEEEFYLKDRENRNYLKKLLYRRALYSATMWNILLAVNDGVMVVATFLISLGAIKGNILVGALLAFINLIGRVQWPFVEISNLYTNLQQNMSAANRVFEILSIQPERVEGIPGGEEMTNGLTAIHLSNVSFAYDSYKEEQGKWLLEELNLKISRGEHIAIVGPSGAGKSTVAKLVCGLYPVKVGSVKIFGNSSEDVSSRKLITYISQSPYIFIGTIKDNIAYAKDGATDEEIISAAKLANAHEFISQFELGYDTVIGEFGSSLSRGQIQRIAIARAFLRQTPIVILDEITSALDIESERRIQSALVSLLQDKAAITITHQFSMLTHVDRIYVMQEGKICAEGSHEELNRTNKLYKSLYNLQQGRFADLENMTRKEG